MTEKLLTGTLSLNTNKTKVIIKGRIVKGQIVQKRIVQGLMVQGLMVQDRCVFKRV